MCSSPRLPAVAEMDQLPDRADWPRLFELKRQWQVAIAALLIRARTLGRMSPSAYLSAMKAISLRGWRRVEPVPLGEPERPQLFKSRVASAMVSAPLMVRGFRSAHAPGSLSLLNGT